MNRIQILQDARGPPGTVVSLLPVRLPTIRRSTKLDTKVPRALGFTLRTGYPASTDRFPRRRTLTRRL